MPLQSEMRILPRLIAFEGIDGSGTTTQAKRLNEGLAKLDIPNMMTMEPSTGEIGKFIRQILKSEKYIGDTSQSWAVMTLLFNADRKHHLDTIIKPAIDDGMIVITDRYLHSTLAYQSVYGDYKTVKHISTMFAPYPELLFLLTVDPKDAKKRKKGYGDELYEELDYQQKVAELYDDHTASEHGLLELGTVSPEMAGAGRKRRECGRRTRRS